MSGIVIYTLPNCPHCNEVKNMLDHMMADYTARSMEEAEVIADLRFNGCFEMEAPIIQIGDKYLTYKEFINRNDKKYE